MYVYPKKGAFTPNFWDFNEDNSVAIFNYSIPRQTQLG